MKLSLFVKNWLITVICKYKIYGEKLSAILGRMHGAQYRGYGYVPLRFGGGGGEGEGEGRRMGTQQQQVSAVPRVEMKYLILIDQWGLYYQWKLNAAQKHLFWKVTNS